MASYTANLAAILLADDTVYAVESIQDVLDQQLTVCIVPLIQPEFLALYPTVKTKIVGDSTAIVSVT